MRIKFRPSRLFVQLKLSVLSLGFDLRGLIPLCLVAAVNADWPMRTLLLVTYGCVFFHELGHYLAVLLLGPACRHRLRVGAFAGHCLSSRPCCARRRPAAFAAGPLFESLYGLALHRAGLLPTGAAGLWALYAMYSWRSDVAEIASVMSRLSHVAMWRRARRTDLAEPALRLAIAFRSRSSARTSGPLTPR